MHMVKANSAVALGLCAGRISEARAGAGEGS